MRSKFGWRWLSEAQTKESTATHIHSSVCRDAKEEFEATSHTDQPVRLYPDVPGLHNRPRVYR